MSAPVAVGDLLDGKYRVESVIGEGGMGIVVAAHHESLGQRFAIKVLTRDENPITAKRFLREGTTASRLQGIHVAKVYDVGQAASGAPFLVMELLQGCDLEQLVDQRGALPVTEAVDYTLQACLGLIEAHAIGLVHRDIKPSNLFLTKRQDGAPLIKVLDFGVSKDVIDPRQATALTATGAVIGSPRFIPPEQLVSSKDVDARADVWSLAVTLFELLTGRSPFRGVAIADIFASIMRDPPIVPSTVNPRIPETLDAVLLKCMQKDPAHRYKNLTELAHDLCAFASPQQVAEIQAALGTGSARTANEFEKRATAPIDQDDLMATQAYVPESERPAKPRPAAGRSDASGWPVAQRSSSAPAPAGQASRLAQLQRTEAMPEISDEQSQDMRQGTPDLAATVLDPNASQEPFVPGGRPPAPPHAHGAPQPGAPQHQGMSPFAPPAPQPTTAPPPPMQSSPLFWLAVTLFTAAGLILVGVGIWWLAS